MEPQVQASQSRISQTQSQSFPLPQTLSQGSLSQAQAEESLPQTSHQADPSFLQHVPNEQLEVDEEKPPSNPSQTSLQQCGVEEQQLALIPSQNSLEQREVEEQQLALVPSKKSLKQASSSSSSQK